MYCEIYYNGEVCAKGEIISVDSHGVVVKQEDGFLMSCNVSSIKVINSPTEQLQMEQKK